MIKKLLISFICILIILMSFMVGYRHYLNICEDFLVRDGAAIESDLQSVDYVFDFQRKKAKSNEKEKYCIVIGKYESKDCFYYSIFSQNGTKITENGFGGSLETCIIHDIRVADNGVYILCEENSFASLYFIDMSDTKKIDMKEQLNFSMLNEDEEKAIKLLLPDDACEYIVSAWNTGANLYKLDGTLVKQYEYTEKSVISCGVYANDTLVLCGAESSFSDIYYFDVAFAEAFNAECESVFYKNLYKKNSCISSAMECQITKNGTLKIFGRYFDYRNSPVVLNSLDVSQYEEYKLYGHGSNYYIYDKVSVSSLDAMQSSVFITEFESTGKEKDVILFSAINDFRVPSISQEKSLDKFNGNGDFNMTLARISPERDSYFLSIGPQAVEIPSNIIMYYDIDDNGGMFTVLRESGTEKYNVFYYDSIGDFGADMNKLLEAMYFSNIFDILLPVITMTTLFFVAFIMLYAKHKWRE